MNNALFIILVAAQLTSYAQNSSNGYTINGRIAGLQDGSTVYLLHGPQRRRIDSAIVTNEQFIIEGKIDEATFTYLYSGTSNKLADILLDNRHIEVVGNKPMYDSINVKGSDIDMQWKEWYKRDQRIGYQKYRLDALYRSLIESKDIERATMIEKISEELLVDRIYLLKEYVRKYHDTPSGAVLPTLCTIQNNLTKSDYLQMYNYLTPAMRSTLFGQEILRLAEERR